MGPDHADFRDTNNLISPARTPYERHHVLEGERPRDPFMARPSGPVSHSLARTSKRKIEPRMNANGRQYIGYTKTPNARNIHHKDLIGTQRTDSNGVLSECPGMTGARTDATMQERRSAQSRNTRLRRPLLKMKFYGLTSDALTLKRCQNFRLKVDSILYFRLQQTRLPFPSLFFRIGIEHGTWCPRIEPRCKQHDLFHTWRYIYVLLASRPP